MIPNWNKILKEWSYRVGVIKPNNSRHLYHLNKILEERGWPYEVIHEVIENLNEVDDDKVIKYKDKDGESQEMTAGAAKKLPKEHPAKIEYEKLKDGDDTEKSANVKGKKDFDRGSNQPEPSKDFQRGFDKPNDVSTEEKRNKDHQTTDKALNRKTTDPSETGVGAGTNESRAGEAATHKALRMLKDGKSYDEIEKYLTTISNEKDTYLDKSWVKASLSATKSIDETYGIDNIDEIVWDTPSGRELINVDEHGTSSDMFIKLKDGERVGISLKKDGKVFIRNGGYMETTNQLYQDLEKYGVSSEDIEDFKSKTDISNYNKDLNQSIEEAVDKMQDDEDVSNIIQKIKDDSDFRKSINISDKYLKRINDEFFDRVAGRSGKRTNDDIKILARVAAAPEYRDKNPEVYQNMRDTDIRNTQRLLDAIGDSKEIESAIKEDVIKGIHIDQIMGLDDEMNLDSFITVYGTTPSPSQLNEQSIIDMFGGDVEQLIAQHNQNPGDDLKKQIKDAIKEEILIDYKDGAKDGIIKIKHEGPPKQEYPLFTIKARARGIGAKPTLEMAQTTFMANALKFGLNVDSWPNAQKNSFLRSLEK